MLVLLPPSETKAVARRGPSLELDALSYPELRSVRERVLTALVRAASDQPDVLRQALGLSDNQRAEVDRDAGLLTAPTLPALALYTGVVFDHLGYASLTGTAKRRANSSLVVASALFGLLRPGDRVPAYRLSGTTRLPGVGALAALWRPVLEPLLAREKGLVVDLRSGVYAQLARVPDAVQVRVLRHVDGRRTTVSHDNKWTKGTLARVLCEQGARTLGDVAEAGGLVADAVEIDGRRVDLVLHGLASAR